MRAVGATGGQVVWMVVIEAIVVGAVKLQGSFGGEVEALEPALEPCNAFGSRNLACLPQQGHLAKAGIIPASFTM